MRCSKEIIVLAILFFLVRVPSLGTDISNTDAMRWHSRSQDFLEAIKTVDLKSTYQHYQPGVTLMWLNAIVKQLSFSIQYHLLGNLHPATLENSSFYPLLDGVSKLALILVLFFLLGYMYLIVKKLFTTRIALLFVFLITIEPYLIGIDRWFHLTSLETYFAFAAYLSFIYWHKYNVRKYLIISAILFALAVLSKLTSLILIPLYLYLFIAKYIKTKDFNVFKDMVLFGVVSAIVFSALFPAVLVDPVYVFTKLFNAATAAVSENYRNELLTPSNRVLFYILVLVLKLSPITLVVLIMSLLNRPNKYILANLATYFVFLTVSDQKIDRYTIAMFPSILLLCANYLGTIPYKYLVKVVAASGLCAGIIYYSYFPVLSAYYSPILGGTNGALRLKLYDNSGEYFAQASLYMNEKGRETKVYVPYGYSSFAPYSNISIVSTLETADYLVTSLDLTRLSVDNMGCVTLDKQFGGRLDAPVVFVFKCSKY